MTDINLPNRFYYDIKDALLDAAMYAKQYDCVIGTAWRDDAGWFLYRTINGTPQKDDTPEFMSSFGAPPYPLTPDAADTLATVMRELAA